MARELHKFAVTVLAGTLSTAPATFPLTMPPRIVSTVEVRIPPGPRGTVGFQLAAAGVQMIPYEPGAFFVGEDDRLSWPLEGQISSGAWQVIAYNTGQYNHTLEFRFLVELPGAVASGATPLIAADALASDASGGLSAPPLLELPPLPAPLPLPVGAGVDAGSTRPTSLPPAPPEGFVPTPPLDKLPQPRPSVPVDPRALAFVGFNPGDYWRPAGRRQPATLGP